MKLLQTTLFLLAGTVSVCASETFEYDAAIECYSCEEWNAPQQPFRIHGNTYYVGSAGLAAILIDTGAGLVLLDGGLPQTAALVAANIETLGFSIEDVQAIGLSHAHSDHAGGLAALQRLSGASVVTSAAAIEALKIGNLLVDDPQFVAGGEHTGFPAVEKTRLIEDSDSISIGDTNITAVYTPGHTPGGMTWSWISCAAGECLNIVYADSLTAVSAPGFLFSDRSADETGAILRHSIERVAELDCDIFLTTHTFMFQMQRKAQETEVGNPFVDDQGCRWYAELALSKLNKRLSSDG